MAIFEKKGSGNNCLICNKKVDDSQWDFFEFVCFNCGFKGIFHKTCAKPDITPFDRLNMSVQCPECNSIIGK